ncbi:MAG: hypothetical protein BroJett038_24250 [Chloroflexota bacterium]|jgi:hypothetical protein|nr:MAG: hypothetical protein BroJett038_24250 [Chloroflexota bacterium]
MMTDEQNQRLVKACTNLREACEDVAKIGRYQQNGLMPGKEFIAVRLEKARKAMEEADAALADVSREEKAPRAAIRPRLR